MKIKKILIYFMISVMMISLSAPVLAEEIAEDEGLIVSEGEKAEKEDDVPETEDIILMPKLSENEELAVSLMTSLSVFEQNTDLTLNLTRGQLAHAVYVLKNFNMISTSAVNTFADIDAGTKYANEISVLYDMGYLTGYKGLYRPDDNVTAAEFATVLIRALGLEFVAKANGEWPVGYMQVADTYNLFKNVKITADKTITVLDAAIIFKNLLEVRFDDEEYNIAGIKGYYMTAVLDIYKADGIVTDNGITSLDGSESRENRICIGKDEYNTNGMDCEAYLGKRVKLYYRETEGDYRYLLAIKESEKQETVYINSEDIEKFENRTYSYYVKDKTKTARFAIDYSIVYNGRLVTDGNLLQEEKLVPDEGYVELIDYDENDEYDLVIIENYVTFVVEEYNANTNILRSQENKVPAINFEKADMDIKIMLGAEGSQIAVDYQNIAHNGYVLSVARSLDERAVKIYLAEETVTGHVGSINRSEKTVIVNGEEYIASRYLPETITSGRSYILHLNHYGHIIWGENVMLAGERYAYVERVYYDSEAENAMLKLYTEDNSYLTAPLSENARIDGIRYTSAESKIDMLESAIGTIIILKTNSDNEIVSVDTKNPNDDFEKKDASLNVLYENQSGTCYDESTLSFGLSEWSKYPTDINTKVFCVKEPYEPGKIYCYSLSEFKSKYVSSSQTDIGSLVLYNTNADSIVGKVALVKRPVIGKSAEYSSNSGAVVTDIKLVLNDYDEEEYILTVQINDTKKEIALQYDARSFNTAGGTHTVGGNNPYLIDCGDIIRWGTNDEGVVEPGNVIVIYDCDKKWFNSTRMCTEVYKRTDRWHYLWIYAKEGDHVLSVSQSNSPVEDFHNSKKKIEELDTYVDYITPLNGQPVTVWVYDMAKKTFKESDIGEFITYKDAGLDECTRMLARYNSGHRTCIIYK